jgi:hypothetical protein
MKKLKKMNKKVLVFGTFLILVAVIFAASGMNMSADSEDPPEGQPFQTIWDEMAELEDELDTHDHEGIFSPSNHNHNSDYADIYHDHDDKYSQLGHIHTEFAPVVHNHNEMYYTKTEVDTSLAGKADSSHDHDDSYYTKSEVDVIMDEIELIPGPAGPQGEQGQPGVSGYEIVRLVVILLVVVVLGALP